jgi:AraC-like DNA-binding protein
MRQSETCAIGLTAEEELLLIQAAVRICIFPIRKIAISELVLETKIQESRLRPAFKALFGMGVYKFHLAARMKEAKRLIEETDLDLKQIAHISGYSHSTNFCNSFRMYFGHSPRFIKWKSYKRNTTAAP